MFAVVLCINSRHDRVQKKKSIFPWFLFLRPRKNFPKFIWNISLLFHGPVLSLTPTPEAITGYMEKGLSWMTWFSGSQSWMHFSMVKRFKNYQWLAKSGLVESELLGVYWEWGTWILSLKGAVTMVTTLSSLHRKRLLASLPALN